jgi:predicted HAD superfamily Cof-like phosphohydrolase
MENPIKAIYKWQVDAGLTVSGYVPRLEASFQIEEALEGFVIPELDGKTFTSHKEIARYIVGKAVDSSIKPITEVDAFDKAIDAIVFGIGAMAKLGLTPQQITKGLLVVNRANVQKLGMPKDSLGKLIKPDNFVGPEVELQRILNER